MIQWLTFLLRIPEMPCSDLRPETAFRGFPQSLLANATTLQLGKDRFLPNPSQFIINVSAFHSTLYNLCY
jgi:hypothetical protein